MSAVDGARGFRDGWHPRREHTQGGGQNRGGTACAGSEPLLGGCTHLRKLSPVQYLTTAPAPGAILRALHASRWRAQSTVAKRRLAAAFPAPENSSDNWSIIASNSADSCDASVSAESTKPIAAGCRTAMSARRPALSRLTAAAAEVPTHASATTTHSGLIPAITSERSARWLPPLPIAHHVLVFRRYLVAIGGSIQVIAGQHTSPRIGIDATALKSRYAIDSYR